MSEWKGKTALITGASYGIGEAFARDLAAAGANLILTARSRDRLEEIAHDLRTRYPVEITIITADLADPAGAESLFRETESRRIAVDLLVNNAGFGAVGDFADLELGRQLGMIQVNVGSLVALTHYFLQQMRARRSGAIINVASTASFQSVPYFAVYGATKAFVLSFSEALSSECETDGVRLLALCPGPTSTRFQSVAGTGARRVPSNMQTAEEVVRVGLDALASGRWHVVSGFPNRIMVIGERLIPRKLVTKAAARLFRQFSTRQTRHKSDR